MSAAIVLQQSSNLPPAQPTYVLRGHAAAIHAVHLWTDNLRLLTGDADGWVVFWDLSVKRPLTVWKPHNGAILGLGSWKDENVITHGRDNKLRVWQIRSEDVANLSTILPIDNAITERKEPWLLHDLAVNALNFCSFAMCDLDPQSSSPGTASEEILIATPGVQDGHVNLTSLPDEERFATISSPNGVNTGMLMAVKLLHASQKLKVLTGYESGHAAMWQQNDSGHWHAVYLQKSHSQPVLSIGFAVNSGSFFTSSADAIIARHSLSGSESRAKTWQTKHAGQQALIVRSDEKIFTTAGWDGRIRVYSVKTMKELAVLKWHNQGCYALALARVPNAASSANSTKGNDDEILKSDLTVSAQRIQKTRTTHWLAAGSKDGKVSLWDIY